MKLSEIRNILDAVVLAGEAGLQKSVHKAYCADLMSDVLSFSLANSLLITGLTNAQVVRTAEMAEIEVIVFIQSKRPDMQTIQLAEEKHIPMLSTDYSMFDACGRLYENGIRSHAYAESRPGT
jgi:predicted transcriptional regulator